MAALAARRMPQQGGRTMAGRMHQQRVCVAADARRAKVMTVAMHSCNCFTTTEIKRMLDYIKQGLAVSLFWHHWSARTNGCTAHKDPGCQGGVFGITTSGVRYYWSGVSVVCLSCQLSVCDSNSLDKRDNHTHLDIPAPKAVHIKPRRFNR